MTIVLVVGLVLPPSAIHLNVGYHALITFLWHVVQIKDFTTKPHCLICTKPKWSCKLVYSDITHIRWFYINAHHFIKVFKQLVLTCLNLGKRFTCFTIS